jgi:hypothetical protein
MARYDKVDPNVGGFRAALAADWSGSDLNKVVGVSLNASGAVVKGTGGQSGFAGVLVLNGARVAGTVVDVMKLGEIVELTGTVAGTKYYAAADGSGLNTTNTNPYVGVTVEADRLVVHCEID